MVDKSFRRLITFVSVIAALYILEKIWQLLSWLGEILLMLALAWLITFILDPVVNWLSGAPLAPPRRLLPRRWRNSPIVERMGRLRLPRGLAVGVVYFVLLSAVAAAAALFLPSVVQQSIQFGAKLPEYIKRSPELLLRLQQTLARFNIQIDLVSLAKSPELIRQAQSLGTDVIQFALDLATGVATALTQAFLILILSLYMMLEKEKVASLIWRLIPEEYHDEAEYASEHLQKVFGAYVRGEILVAMLYGLVVTVVMYAAGLNFALPIGIFCGAITLVPYLGDPIAMFLPPLIALLQQSGNALWVFLVLAVFQQILVRFLLPKIVSEATGMPALLVIVSILVGVKLIGFWGFVFAIPVAGMIYATGLYLLEERRKLKERTAQPCSPAEDEDV